MGGEGHPRGLHSGRREWRTAPGLGPSDSPDTRAGWAPAGFAGPGASADGPVKATETPVSKTRGSVSRGQKFTKTTSL